MKPPAFGWFLTITQLASVVLFVGALVLYGITQTERADIQERYVQNVRRLSHRIAEGRCMWVAPPTDTSKAHHW